MNVNQLADAYLTDPDSNFSTRRYVTREGYKRLIGRIRKDLGERDLSTLKVREVKHAHDAWASSGVAMAHRPSRCYPR